MKHKMKFLILGCVVLMGLVSFTAIADDTSENSATENSRMKEVHTIVGPPEISCPFMERPSLEEEFKRVDLVFTGVLTDKIVEKMVVKREVPKKNIVRHRHITIFKSIFEVTEVFKSPINFDGKTIHVVTLSADGIGEDSEIGEEFIIYAFIRKFNGKEIVKSTFCEQSSRINEKSILRLRSVIDEDTMENKR